MGDRLPQDKVHNCTGADCKVRISSYDPHTVCDNCKGGPCTLYARCSDCIDLTDSQFYKLLNIKKENKRKREVRASISQPVTTVPEASTSAVNSPPPSLTSAELASLPIQPSPAVTVVTEPIVNIEVLPPPGFENVGPSVNPKSKAKESHSLKSVVQIVKTKKKSSLVSSKLSPKVKVPVSNRDGSVQLAKQLEEFKSSMLKIMAEQLGSVKEEFNKALEHRSKVDVPVVSEELDEAVHSVARTIVQDILHDSVVGVVSGEESGPCSPALPLTDPSDSFSMSARSRFPINASPPGVGAAKSPTSIQVPSSLPPSLSFPAAAPQSDSVRFGTRLVPAPYQHLTGDGAASSFWGGSSGHIPVTRMIFPSTLIGAGSDHPVLPSHLNYSAVRPTRGVDPFSENSQGAFSFSDSQPSNVMTTFVTVSGGVAVTGSSSRPRTTIPFPFSSAIASSSLVTSHVHSSSFGDCNAFYTTSISSFPISSTVPMATAAPSVPLPKTSTVPIATAASSVPRSVSFVLPDSSAPSAAAFDWIDPSLEEDQTEEGEWLGEGVEEEECLEFQPFKELSSLAQSLGPDYVARHKQKKRPSPFELSSCVSPKFKKATQFLAWSSVVFEALDLVNDKFRTAASQNKVNPRFLLPMMGNRVHYATMKMPEFVVNKEFFSLLDGRKKFSKNHNVLVPQVEFRILLRSLVQILEILSFLSWHLGSIGSFLKSAADQVGSDPSIAKQKLSEAHTLLGSLDRATTDGVGVVVPTFASLLSRFRYFHLAFMHPLISVPRRSELLFGSVDFNNLLDPDILDIVRDEVKLAESSAMSRALAMSAARLSGPPSSSSARGKRGRPSFNTSVSRSPRGRRPFRGGSSSTRPGRGRAGRGGGRGFK